jgi:hypothetical protein
VSAGGVRNVRERAAGEQPGVNAVGSIQNEQTAELCPHLAPITP